MKVPEIPDSQLTLFLTGFEQNPWLPESFSRLLARADRLADLRESCDLLTLFGVDTPPGQDKPIAAISRVADMGVIDNEWWIRADPVHLQPQRDGLVLHNRLELTRNESEQLVAELNESLTAEGWLIKAPHPGRWYLKPAQEPRLTTTSMADALGRNVHPLLPQGEDRAIWHTRLNEIQILLHTSSINAEREGRGAPTANSVWFWGGGRLPRLGRVAWTRLWANNELASGLARLADLPVQVHEKFPATQSRTTRELFVFDLLEGNTETLQPLNDIVIAMNAGHYSSLTIVMDTRKVFRYLPWHRWRFWRKIFLRDSKPS